MAKFSKSEENVEHEADKVFSKEEFDAKKQAAFDARSIISWKSPVRVFIKRSNKYFTKVGVFALIAILA